MARVDANLDWKYEKLNGVYRWTDEGKKISMYKKNRTWVVECKFEDKFEHSFESFSQGFRYVRTIIKESND